MTSERCAGRPPPHNFVAGNLLAKPLFKRDLLQALEPATDAQPSLPAACLDAKPCANAEQLSRRERYPPRRGEYNPSVTTR